MDINLIYVDMKQSIPEYYSKNPKIFFTPLKPGAEKAAEIKELLVNQKWGKRKMKRVMREAIKLAKLHGMVGFKTYFYFNSDGSKNEWGDRVENDDVRTDLIQLKDLVKDPDATSWEESPWVAHKVKDLRKNIAKKFNIRKDDQEKIAITATSGSRDKIDQMSADIKDEFLYGTYYEVEDRANERLFVIIEGFDKAFDVKDIENKFDSMYDFLSYNDIPGRQPYSDYHFWHKQVKEMSIYRTMMASHAKKGNSKYKVLGKALTDEQQAQLSSSKDTAFVNLEAGQDVQPLQHAKLDPQIVKCYSLAAQDVQLISKQAPRQNVGGDKTATEVKAIEIAAKQVSSENLDRLEEVMASIANKWALLMEENYTTKRVVALTEMSEAQFLDYQDSLGENIKGKSKNPFLDIRQKDLVGECEASVEAGSTMPDDEQTRINKLMGFAKFIAAIGAAGAIDIEEAVEEGVNAFGVRNDNLLRRKDNPMEESRLLNSGVFISAKMTEDHDKHLEIHEMESNGNSQNLVHILEHKLFKQQLDQNKEAAIKSASMKIEEQVGGQSFLNPTAQSPLPAQNEEQAGGPVAPINGGLPQ